MYQTKTGEKLNDPTRLHSGRMRTAHLLTVSPSMHYAGGVCLVGGVPGARGVCSQGRCLVWGGCRLLGDGFPGPGVSQHVSRHPTDEETQRRFINNISPIGISWNFNLLPIAVWNHVIFAVWHGCFSAYVLFKLLLTLCNYTIIM